MWNLKEFESVYGRYKKSGLRVKDFCMNECISENKFYYRQKRLKKQGKESAQPSEFIPIVFHQGQTSPENVVCRDNPLARDHHTCDGRCGGYLFPVGLLQSCGCQLPRPDGLYS
jgi:hypothetical protein